MKRVEKLKKIKGAEEVCLSDDGESNFQIPDVALARTARDGGGHEGGEGGRTGVLSDQKQEVREAWLEIVDDTTGGQV